jgi:hypothetical protein
MDFMWINGDLMRFYGYRMGQDLRALLFTYCIRPRTVVVFIVGGFNCISTIEKGWRSPLTFISGCVAQPSIRRCFYAQTLVESSTCWQCYNVNEACSPRDMWMGLCHSSGKASAISSCSLACREVAKPPLAQSMHTTTIEKAPTGVPWVSL